MHSKLKSLIPPIFYELKNRYISSRYGWKPFKGSWEEALAQTSSYDNDAIIEKVKTALLKVKNGEAVYERDSVLFDKIQYSWGLLAGLQKAAIENNFVLNVLDFGGSLGSSYYQNRSLIGNSIQLSWNIVEQERFVKCGKSHFETNELRFYDTIEECMKQNNPNVLLLSGVLQYLQYPQAFIQTVNKQGFSYIIIDRTAFNDGMSDILTIQQVPKKVYNASYPAWCFSENIIEHFTNYIDIAQFDNGFTKSIKINKKNICVWKGVILKRK